MSALVVKFLADPLFVCGAQLKRFAEIIDNVMPTLYLEVGMVQSTVSSRPDVDAA